MGVWRVLGVVLAVGCAGGGEEDSGTKVPGDTDEEPEPVEQAAVCEAWLACLEIADPGVVSTVMDRYGATGTCWVDAETAALCEQECQASLSTMNDVYPDVPECDDGLPDDTGDIEGRWAFTVASTGGDCAGSTITRYDLIFDALDPATMTAEVYSILDLDGTEATIAFDLPCTFDGTAVACDAVTTYGGAVVADLDGTYAGDSIDAEATYEITTDGTCTLTAAMSGARY